MRTTLDIDEDVLLAVKDLARRERRSAGQVLSELARQGLHGAHSHSLGVSEPAARFGFSPEAASGLVVTNAQIDALRESLGEGQARAFAAVVDVSHRRPRLRNLRHARQL